MHHDHQDGNDPGIMLTPTRDPNAKGLNEAGFTPEPSSSSPKRNANAKEFKFNVNDAGFTPAPLKVNGRLGCGCGAPSPKEGSSSNNFRSEHHEEEFHTRENYVKLATSFGLALPAYNGLVAPASHAFVREMGCASSSSLLFFAHLLNPIAWGILTLGCLFHHGNPSSKFFHDCDHW
jgi:hypothetical protein